MLVLWASVFLIACNKDDDSSKQQARLLVANAAITPNSVAPIGPAIDVSWDGQLIIPNVIYGAAGRTNGSPLTSLGAATSPQIVSQGDYAPVKPGAFGLNLRATFNTVNPPGVNLAGSVLYDRTTSLLPGRSYTALAFDFVPLYRTLVMEDDLTPPPPGKIKVRFMHAVPQPVFIALGVPRRDTVDVTGFGGLSTSPLNNTAIFPNRTFGDAFQNTRFQQFAVLDSGSYRFGVRVAGTPGTSAATGALGLFPASGSPIRLTEGKIYTIIARLHPTGVANPPLQPGVTIVTHN